MKQRYLALSVFLVLGLAFLVACQSYHQTKPATGDRIRVVKFTIPSCG